MKPTKVFTVSLKPYRVRKLCCMCIHDVVLFSIHIHGFKYLNILFCIYPSRNVNLHNLKLLLLLLLVVLSELTQYDSIFNGCIFRTLPVMDFANFNSNEYFLPVGHKDSLKSSAVWVV